MAPSGTKYAGKQLFEDSDFKTIDNDNFIIKKTSAKADWKRPWEIVEDPKMFVDGASRFDVNQGRLGDCWLLAAIAGLSQHQELLERVIPPDQGFDDGYTGKFRFNFWLFGKWTEIVIDDRLPTVNGNLIFTKSTDKHEFWSALLEKAYAKVFGGYEKLKGGQTSVAMENFTGGLTEEFVPLEEASSNLFSIMRRALQRGSLLGCTIPPPQGAEEEHRLPNGLVCGHAYTITAAIEVDATIDEESTTVQLVRIRNPWGNAVEWNGAWSDKSKEWNAISEEERKRVGLAVKEDGEFWMSYEDFIGNYYKMEICHLGPDAMKTTPRNQRWEATLEQGNWRKKVSAGGCRRFPETFWTNPQFRVEVADVEEDDEDNTNTLLVSVMQKDTRKKRLEGATQIKIGYVIFELPSWDSGPQGKRFFRTNKPVVMNTDFRAIRQVSGRHELEPGTYCVVPSTYNPDEEGEFILRIFAEKPVLSNELDENTEVNEIPHKELTPEQQKVAEQAKEIFKQISGEDLEVDAWELQKLLNSTFRKEFKFDGFNISTCTSLVAMRDRDRSGKLSLAEFNGLWQDLCTWEDGFRKHDADKSGTFDCYELREALKAIGITVSNSTLNSIVQRYSSKDGKIYFDQYIECVARLCNLIETFKLSGANGKTRDEFIAAAIYS